MIQFILRKYLLIYFKVVRNDYSKKMLIIVCTMYNIITQILKNILFEKKYFDIVLIKLNIRSWKKASSFLYRCNLSKNKEKF